VSSSTNDGFSQHAEKLEENKDARLTRKEVYEEG
jgi:hypothetical protein